MSDALDMLGALIEMTSLYAVTDVTESNEYYIVAFEGTTATLLLDAREVTLEQIQTIIAEATRS